MIQNLINKDKDLQDSNNQSRTKLDNSSSGDVGERLHTLTGYETTEFTTDGSSHPRSEGNKLGVDFNRDHSEAQRELDGRQLAAHNSLLQRGSSNNEDVENIYTTEMEEGEENDLKTRKSIIRSELKDGSASEES